MKKLLTSLAFAAASCVAATSANAGTLVLDDFSLPLTGVILADWDGVLQNDNDDIGVDGTLRDTLVTAPASAYVTSRRVNHRLDVAPVVGPCVFNCFGTSSNVSVGGAPADPTGALSISNIGGRDSTVQVIWNLGPIVASGAGAISLDIMTNDFGTTTGIGANIAEYYLDGVSLGTVVLAPAGGMTFFNLSAPQIASLADGGQFRLDFDGKPEWDLVVDNLSLTVPQPGTLALVGAALLGLGAAARRRASTKA